ncbi:MAG: DUF302 domain-containing protein [Candidatus Thiodiazotropha sp. (ex Monitilora ramsayi)]|nr:DUF302 domain-containing protein [Candidatus Thiodiazotropha sp. (ex Monitilora ramsayi)]
MTKQFTAWLTRFAFIFFSGTIFCAAPVVAGDIEKHGNAFVIYLPGNLDYLEIVDRLKSEILAANWEITDVQEVDIGLRQYGVKTENKVISACKSQLLAQAIKEDPFISLAVPCRFTAFRDEANNRFVIGFSDPAAEAKSLNVSRYGAAEQATEELKGVLQTIADFYK